MNRIGVLVGREELRFNFPTIVHFDSLCALVPLPLNILLVCATTYVLAVPSLLLSLVPEKLPGSFDQRSLFDLDQDLAHAQLLR